MCLFTSARTVAIVFARSAGSEAMYCAGVLTFDGGFMDSSSSRTKCISVSTAGEVATSARRPARIRADSDGRDRRQRARRFRASHARLAVQGIIMQLEPLVAALPAVADGPGRPRRKPGAVQGDRAYWWWPSPPVLMAAPPR